MASSRILFVVSILLCSFAMHSCYASELFSNLKKSILVTSSAKHGQVLKSGEANITVTWSFNKTFPAGADSTYKTVKVKLCYAPISQKDRGWRKTKDELKKDRTCQHKIVKRKYEASKNSVTWTIERDIPKATYFVRVYVFNAEDKEVAYGQTTNTAKKTNLFEVEAITGRHASLDIASVCFSVFSIVSLAGFFYLEKRKGSSQQK
ncbi:High-affinity nitrate transporter [Heracleum sosnowskyi]|uniref:High-affinity nitrate transporter n=1 Tax=Heracleum sosnowskyi TaxID=360622 RepID=A0AAD8H278_9APIA|nr:High-affinity nitrate transporter [Heracleum sosnowskyi]